MRRCPTGSPARSLARRDWLKLSGAALAGAALAPPGAALAQAPKAAAPLPSAAGIRRTSTYELQRYLARQQYYVQLPSAGNIAAWDDALKNYGPNLGYDYGGRLVSAWLDR